MSDRCINCGKPFTIENPIADKVEVPKEFNFPGYPLGTYWEICTSCKSDLEGFKKMGLI